MSRSTLLGIIVVCLVGAFLIGITVLLKARDEHTLQQATRAVGPALQQAARQAADEAGRQAAREMADKLLPGGQESAGATPPTSNTAPQSAPIKVEREAFEITLPPGSTVDPEDASIGSEHLVTSNVSGHATVSIAVFDNKDRAGTSFEEMLTSFRGKVEKAEEEKPEAFDSLRVVRATGLRGTIKGEEFGFEIGQCEGWDKGFVIVAEYPEENKAEEVTMIGKALGTFRMKQ